MGLKVGLSDGSKVGAKEGFSDGKFDGMCVGSKARFQYFKNNSGVFLKYPG